MSNENVEKKISRRRYLELAGGTVAGLVIGGALGYAAKPTALPQLVTNTVTETVTASGAATTATATAGAAEIFKSIDPKQFAGEEIVVAMLGGLEDPFRPYIPDFEKETGISVKLDTMGWPDAIDKQSLTYGTGAYQWDVGWGPTWATKGWIADGFVESLEPYIEDKTITDDGVLALDDIIPNLLNQCGKEGVVGPIYDNPAKQMEKFLLPYFATPDIAIMRSDLAKKYGVQMPDTTEDFENAAKALNHPSDGVYGWWQRTALDEMAIYFAYIYAFGGTIFDKNMNPTMDAAGTIEAYEYMARMVKNYSLPGIHTYADIGTDVAQGKSALMYDAGFTGPTLEDPKTSVVAGKLEYGLAPRGPAGRFPGEAPLVHFIPITAKHKKAAWLFTQWFSGPEVTVNAGLSGQTPCRMSAWNDPRYSKMFNEWDGYADAILKTLKIEYPYYVPGVKPIISLYHHGTVMLQDIIGGMASDKAAQKANAAIYDVMKAAGYYST